MVQLAFHMIHLAKLIKTMELTFLRAKIVILAFLLLVALIASGVTTLWWRRGC